MRLDAVDGSEVDNFLERGVGPAVYEPRWRWSEHVRPLAGTELCEVSHVGIVVAGSAAVLMADGREEVMHAGDIFAIPSGHDSWVVGDELHLAPSVRRRELRDLAAAGRACAVSAGRVEQIEAAEPRS